jgi:hypothetical protein
MRIALVLLLAALMPTAAVAADPPTRRAGVVSLLGESPQWVVPGSAKEAGAAQPEAPAGWEMDYYVETLVARHVSAFGFEPVVPDKAARAALPSLEEFARRHKLDAIFIVTPARVPTQFKDSSDSYTGYGRWSRDGAAGCFAAIRISYTDASGKVLKQEEESRVQRSKDRDIVGKRLPQLSQAQALLARECIEDVIEVIQDLALRRMGY